MAKNCEKCKFHNSDYEFDEDFGEEVEIPYCEKNLKEFLHDGAECTCFERYVIEKYKEEYSKCDICNDSGDCDLIETTTSEDVSRHYIGAIGNKCKRE